MKITHLFTIFLKKIERSLIVYQNEPQVKKRRDRYGNSCWQVRDPKTNKSYSFNSDLEVIAWIEQRDRNV